MKYIIIRGYGECSVADVEISVNDIILQGFVPQGGLYIKGDVAYQAMVKTTE